MTRQIQKISSGIIPVIFNQGKPEFLLLRVYHYWDFPKGLVEKIESPLAAALRELREETGLSDAQFEWGKSYYETEVYSNHKVARYYIASVRSEAVQLTRNEKTGIIEHHESRWCTYPEATQLLGDRVRLALNWGYEIVLR